MNHNIVHQEHHNKGLFEIYINNKLAGYLKYDVLPNKDLLANGTFVYEDFRSFKLGQHLYEALVQLAQTRGVKINPTCPYILGKLQKDPNAKTLIADKI